LSEELIVRPGGEVAIPPAINFEQDAVTSSGLTAADLAFPFLRLFQDNSHEVKKKDPKYIEGAEAGFILNTVTQEIFPGDPGVLVVPVTTGIRKVDEWVPLDQGGGFVGSYFPEHDRVKKASPGKKKGVMISPDGNDLVETAYFFIVFPETLSWACVTMASTKWKVARRWNTLIDGVRLTGAKGPFRPAPYAFSYILGTTAETNNASQTYYNYTIKSAGKVADVGVYQYAREFANTLVAKVKTGEVEVKPPSENPTTEGSPEDIPF